MTCDDRESAGNAAETIMNGLAPGAFPRLREMALGHAAQPGHDVGDFSFGLELILDGLEQFLFL